MDGIFEGRDGRKYLFARQQDFEAFKNFSGTAEFVTQNNTLLAKDLVISRLVPVEHIAEAVQRINKFSLQPERKMPSGGWRFELYKDKNGFLQDEFTKKEWLKKGVEYVNVSFAVASVFERPETKNLLSYFQQGGLLERIAPNVYYYYDRLFAKYGGRPAVFKIEDVPDLEGFMQAYMPELYADLLATATYQLLEAFDTGPYVEQIIKNHYTYT